MNFKVELKVVEVSWIFNLIYVRIGVCSPRYYTYIILVRRLAEAEDTTDTARFETSSILPARLYYTWQNILVRVWEIKKEQYDSFL